MLCSGCVKYYSEFIVFIGYVYIYCVCEYINCYVDVDVGKFWVNSVEDSVFMW